MDCTLEMIPCEIHADRALSAAYLCGITQRLSKHLRNGYKMTSSSVTMVPMTTRPNINPTARKLHKKRRHVGRARRKHQHKQWRGRQQRRACECSTCGAINSQLDHSHGSKSTFTLGDAKVAVALSCTWQGRHAGQKGKFHDISFPRLQSR